MESTEHIRTTNCYMRLLARYPVVVVALVLVGIGICLGVCIVFHPPPDFSKDPVAGFETRGTTIRSGYWTLLNLRMHLEPNGIYRTTPNINKSLNSLGITHEMGKKLMEKFYASRSIPRRPRRSVMQNNTYSCASTFLQLDWYIKFVFESSTGEDLFTVESLHAICSAQDTFIRPHISSNCPLISVPLLVALLNGKSDCYDITASDVTSVRQLLAQCSPFYQNSTLTGFTDSRLAKLNGMNPRCGHGGYVFKLLHYLTDTWFYGSQAQNLRLTYAMSYLILDMSYFDDEPLFTEHFADSNLDNGKVYISAMNLREHLAIKYHLFAKYLVDDIKYFGVAIALIVLLMFLYLRSFVILLATILNVLFSFIFAYFLYFVVCRVTYYPFINLLAGLLLIGVGADDVFIFYDAWQQAKGVDESPPLDIVMSKTFNHAAKSIAVTSLTTAAAFFANVVSSITALRCFAIFAGLAILSNLLFMVTWTPSVIALLDLVVAYFMKNWCKTVPVELIKFIKRLTDKLGLVTEFLFKWFFSSIVERAWFVCISILLALGLAGAVVVFITPKLKLPESKNYQVFRSTNLLERWDMEMRSKFDAQIEAEKNAYGLIPLTFVWGVRAVDNGDWLDPNKPGESLAWDSSFDFYNPESQTWFLDFCSKLRNVSFIQPAYRKKICGLERYKSLIQNLCNNKNFSPYIKNCCTMTEFPYDSETFEKCVPIMELLSQYFYGHSYMGHPIFDADNRVVAYIYDTRSIWHFSFSYDTMDDNYHHIKNFTDNCIGKAPKGLQSGFYSDQKKFFFYDLQYALSTGTYYSIALSVAVAFVVMLLTSLNVLVTIYAIVTIALAIVSTVSSIVLLGWNLNIVESITISLAVGLSIDFTIHYGVAYRNSKCHTSQSRVRESFWRVGPAVAMAALTTFVAGLAVIPAKVLAYRKLGIFLMLAMTFSWIYATFFFQSLCRVIGPKRDCCHLRSHLCKKAKGSYNVNGEGAMATTQQQPDPMENARL